MSGKDSRGVRSFLFAATAAVVFFLLIELILRATGAGLLPQEKTYTDVYDPEYELVPGAPVPYSPVREFLNGDGFRGRRLDPEKPAGVFRAVCAGDSTTFGGFVENEQTYSYLLEKNLLQSGYRVEVMNAGVPGTALWQQRMLIERRLLDFHPDLLILYTSPSYRADFYVLHEAEMGRVNLRRFQRGLARLRAYRLLRNWLRPPRFEDVVSQYFDGRARPDGEVDADLAMKAAREDLARIRDLARSKGVALLAAPLAVALPFRSAKDAGVRPGDPGWRAILDRDNKTHALVKILGDLDIPACDPSDAFLEAWSRESLFVDEVHFSPAGHALMSEVLEKCLRETGLGPAKN